MAVSLKQFISYLDEAEIMTAEAVREWIANQPIEARPIDGAALAKALRNENILSKFQAQRLCQGKVQSLQLDNYRLIKIIGRGGMGIVYEAEHKTMKHRVAIKVISSKVTASDSTLRRFFREVEVAAKLSHPNIVTAIDANQSGKKYYMVMELVQGEDLGVIVQRETVLTVFEVIDYMTQAAVGLAYAHSQGVIHRDIKPHNMLLDENGIIKILDMGLVSLQRPQGSDDESITQHNQIIGTVDYMSPEQAEDVHHVDQRADIYSLGCSIFRLLVGHAPFPGSSAIKKLLSHRDDPIPSLHDSRDDIPELLDQIFRRMLAKDPNNRYQTMDEVVGALETCRLATVPLEPSIQTSESVINSIQSIDLDLGDNNASTLEVERPNILLPVEAKVSQSSRRTVPNIESDSVTVKRNKIRTYGKVNYYITFLTILILSGLVGGVWYQNRPGYVQVQFPVEYRNQRWEIKITSAGKEIYKINDSQDDGLSDSNPISIPLKPGSYEYVLERPPYFAETGKFVIARGDTIIVNGENWTTSDLQEMGLDGDVFKLVPKEPDTNQ